MSEGKPRQLPGTLIRGADGVLYFLRNTALSPNRTQGVPPLARLPDTPAERQLGLNQPMAFEARRTAARGVDAAMGLVGISAPESD